MILGLSGLLNSHRSEWTGEFVYETRRLGNSPLFPSVDTYGRPVPCSTYSFIASVDPRVLPHVTVFEYGGGNSNFWWTERASSAHVVEHNRRWFDHLSDELPANVLLSYVAIGREEEHAGNPRDASQRCNSIIFDSQHIVLSAERWGRALLKDGLIACSLASYQKYVDRISDLKVKRFKLFDCAGWEPINSTISMNIVFFKNLNCLET